eukprot:112389-Rhodomonas_salina.1
MVSVVLMDKTTLLTCSSRSRVHAAALCTSASNSGQGAQLSAFRDAASQVPPATLDALVHPQVSEPRHAGHLLTDGVCIVAVADYLQQTQRRQRRPGCQELTELPGVIAEAAVVETEALQRG